MSIKLSNTILMDWKGPCMWVYEEISEFLLDSQTVWQFNMKMILWVLMKQSVRLWRIKIYTYLINNKNPGVSLLQMTRVTTTSTTTTTTLQLWLELLMQPPALDCSYCQQHWSAMQHFYTANLKHFTQLQFQFQLETELASVLLVPATHPSVKVYLQVQLKVSLLYGSPTV